VKIRKSLLSYLLSSYQQQECLFLQRYTLTPCQSLLLGRTNTQGILILKRIVFVFDFDLSEVLISSAFRIPQQTALLRVSLLRYSHFTMMVTETKKHICSIVSYLKYAKSSTQIQFVC